MVRIFKILFLLILFPLSGWTQETETVFKGTVTNTNGKGIANVLCKALNTNDSLFAENGGYPPTQNGDIRSLFWLFSLMALQN